MANCGSGQGWWGRRWNCGKIPCKCRYWHNRLRPPNSWHAFPLRNLRQGWHLDVSQGIQGISVKLEADRCPRVVANSSRWVWFWIISVLFGYQHFLVSLYGIFGGRAAAHFFCLTPPVLRVVAICRSSNYSGSHLGGKFVKLLASPCNMVLLVDIMTLLP